MTNLCQVESHSSCDHTFDHKESIKLTQDVSGLREKFASAHVRSGNLRFHRFCGEIVDAWFSVS